VNHFVVIISGEYKMNGQAMGKLLFSLATVNLCASHRLRAFLSGLTVNGYKTEVITHFLTN